MTAGNIIQFSKYCGVTSPTQPAPAPLSRSAQVIALNAVDTVVRSSSEHIAREVKSRPQSTGEVDLKKFKQWIADGHYHVDAMELAEILVDSVFE